jgi:hypothetical protein
VSDQGRRPQAEPHDTAPTWAPVWVRRGAGVVAVGYLLAVWLDAAGVGLPNHLLPLPVRFFVQAAELFPHAAQDAVEWRAKAWRCNKGQFEELDVRPYFPIRRDDKESRFYRAMFFHYRQRRVMAALEEFLITEENRAHPDDRIGGVMLLSLLVPIPPPGGPEQRYQRLPITAYPPSVARHYWYVAAPEDCRRRCAEGR